MATTTTPTADAEHRPTGRPVGTYTTDAGAQRRVWRQPGRHGLRLVDVALNGRGRRPGDLGQGRMGAGPRVVAPAMDRFPRSPSWLDRASTQTV